MIIVLKALKDRGIAMTSKRSYANGYAQGHIEGHTEGKAETAAEFRRWIKRQQKVGRIDYDEADPPPG